MAQSTTTVTPPTPTPPTNFACTGATGPNPPNYKRGSYNEYLRAYPTSPTTTVPWFDDGSAGALTTFATNTSALASGTSAADNAGGTALAGAGGTGLNSTAGTYIGATSGLVPASTSSAHEASGYETVITAPGNIDHTYVGAVVFSLGKSVVMYNAAAPGYIAFSGVASPPNMQHASSMSPATNPALVSISPTTLASASSGTQLITATGTGFVPGCRIWHDNVQQDTTWVSATSLTALVNKKPHPGAVPVVVKLGGLIMGATTTFTWT